MIQLFYRQVCFISKWLVGVQVNNKICSRHDIAEDTKGVIRMCIEEKQTTQWPKEKVQKDKQRSTKHSHKNKDRVTRTPLKTGGGLWFSGRVSSSCLTSGTRRFNLVTNMVTSHE